MVAASCRSSWLHFSEIHADFQNSPKAYILRHMYVCAGVVNNVVSPNPMQNFLYPAEEGWFARESFPILLPRNSEENYVRDDHLVENASNVNNVSWVVRLVEMQPGSSADIHNGGLCH
ncbi:unnamed protein product [Lasius platythorax]|uniref:Uncharacterized protein n=1 Tax=Lasius platythorax TaxID=488582 RepID=A0AAV2NK62_9HYME